MNHFLNYKSNRLTLVVFFLACGWTWQHAVSQESKTQDSSQKVSELISQLKSGSYQERDSASSQLLEMGGEVVDPLFEALGSGDFETSFRALKIIKRIGLSSDLDTLERIIVRSQKLPQVLQEQFGAWSSAAIENWKESQSKIAVKKLAKNGATIVEYDDVSELGLLLIEDLGTQVKQLKNKDVPVTTILDQIAVLKKELAGEFVEPTKKDEPSKQSDLDQVVQEFDIRGRAVIRGRVIRGGEILIPNQANPEMNPKKITFDQDWGGDQNDLMNLNFVANLRQVEFVEMDISAELLAKLKKVRNLRSLQLTRCTFSFTDLRQFKQDRDKYFPFQLMATGAGYLGVYGPSTGEPDNGNGSYVSLVSPDSAASAAGLERGDMIVKVDDEQIRSFAELSLVISSKPVGKKIKIAVKRDTEEKVLTAVLKSRAGLR